MVDVGDTVTLPEPEPPPVPVEKLVAIPLALKVTVQFVHDPAVILDEVA